MLISEALQVYIQEQTFNSNYSLVGESVKIKRNTFRFFSCQHFKQFMGLQRISHYVTFKNEIILLVDYLWCNIKLPVYQSYFWRMLSFDRRKVNNFFNWKLYVSANMVRKPSIGTRRVELCKLFLIFYRCHACLRKR